MGKTLKIGLLQIMPTNIKNILVKYLKMKGGEPLQAPTWYGIAVLVFGLVILFLDKVTRGQLSSSVLIYALLLFFCLMLFLLKKVD
jgi:hypothetical protein